MNIEMRHILRWGVPGWLFIAANLITLIYYKPTLLNNFLKESLGIAFLTTAILLWSGIVVGYLFYQVYFGVREILREVNKYKDPAGYTSKEGYVWHLYILEVKDEEDRKYITGRHAYYLTVIHGFGSLLSIWAVTMIIDLIVLLTQGYNNFILYKFFIESFFATFAFLSYTHYHFDLNNFRVSLLNESKLLKTDIFKDTKNK
ncbi:hypothetical protein [Sporosarcina sp. SAFN-010]|uniref:hypothetical protein n=1 Tax=Sporosarcina sp. SAFN-010 TaxID=3387273 RepID=UPI003F8176F5